MKKIFTFIMFIGLLIGLSSCFKEMTYDDLLFAYQSDLEARSDLYNEYIKMYEELSTETIKSVVKVTKKVDFSVSSKLGSGFIFYEDLKFYYVLTNHHVVYESAMNPVTITVTDYLGKNHIANLLALDPDYDLAVLSFPKSGNFLQAMTFSNTDLLFKDIVIVMGYPNGQINAITMGKLVNFDNIDITTEETPININFDVFFIDAPVEAGSSGSVLMNKQYEVVGIIYAGNFLNHHIVSDFAFSIPKDKILEFLELYHFLYKVRDQS